MAKRIFLSPSNQDKNTYSYGNTTEDVQCGKIARACETALKRCGFEVKVEQYDTMQNRVQHSDEWGADLHIPIHTNAFNGKVGGTRTLYCKAGTEGHKAAKALLSALKDLTPGTSDRCNLGSTLYELKTPKATAAYVEAEFHDVPEYAKWIIEHTTEIGEAICKGVCDYYGVEYKAEEEEKPQVATLYRVQVGAFSRSDYATAYLRKVKAAGFTAFTVISDGIYKIQIGAYSKKENALNAVTAAKKAGFDAFITSDGGKAVVLTEVKIGVGSNVKLKKGAKTYAGKSLASFVFNRVHKVSELKGDRAVITYSGVVVAAVNVNDLELA